MKKNLKPVIIITAILIITTLCLFGCKDGVVSSEQVEETAEAVEQVEEITTEVIEVAESAESYDIAFSNGFITHSWRTQMVKNATEAVAWYQGKGLIDNFYIQHAGFDVDLQIQHIRNFMNMGVDAIVVDALSTTAINPVLEEAMEMGILVVAEDMPITSEKIWQIRPRHETWIEELARYVFERIDGKGSIIYLSGISGAPVSDMRDEGFYKALEDYPEIELLTVAQGNWDPSLAKQAMVEVLAAFPKIDAVVSQDGQCISVIQAFEEEGRGVPIMNGEYSRPFCEYWAGNLENDFTSYAIVHGPGQPITAALGMTINLLQGKEFKKDLPEIVTVEDKEVVFGWRKILTDENVIEELEKHIQTRGIEDYIDMVWTYDEISEWFE